MIVMFFCDFLSEGLCDEKRKQTNTMSSPSKSIKPLKDLKLGLGHEKNLTLSTTDEVIVRMRTLRIVIEMCGIKCTVLTTFKLDICHPKNSKTSA